MLALAKEFQSKPVQFYLVDSNSEDSAEILKRYVKERNIPFPAIKDSHLKLADQLNAQVTPQAIVLDSKGEIRYTGRIDDNKDRAKVVKQDVREAILSLLSGSEVKYARTLPFGCTIFRESAKPVSANSSARAVTYTRDVAKILNNNCVTCHRPGEVAPFSLESYQQAKTWSSAIRDYTSRKIMPPWKPVAGYGEFHDERGLSKADIDTLSAWAASGAPQGDVKYLPQSPSFASSTSWKLGTPDIELKPVAAYHLESEGKDVYRNFVLPVNFKEDVWVQGIEFRPDNHAIVHHMVAYIDPTGKSVEMDGKEKEPGYSVPGLGIGIMQAEYGDVWVPGNPAKALPSGVAVKIPAGSKLVLQVHYHKTGKPEVDRSQVALYFAKDKIKQQMITYAMGNFNFELKPGLDKQEVHCSITLPVDVHVRSMFPHMHMLGREMKVTAKLPDGTVRKLIYVDDWDFSWQATYYYKEPVFLPKGTKMDVVATYDNSAKNPRQTSQPPVKVSYGEQTTDEMCFAIFGLTMDTQNLNITPRPTISNHGLSGLR